MWVVETKDGEPRFAHVKHDVCLDYIALLDASKRKQTKPQPVPYTRAGQQELFQWPT